MSNVEDKIWEHLVKDKLITRKEVTKHENVLNSQTRSWIEMLSIGSECGQKERTKSNLITEKKALPLMKGTAKDHKVANDPPKGPKMRPIMGARVGPNTGLSQIGSRILRSIIDDVKVRHDVKSTEEMLAKIEQYNESLKSKKSKKKMILASLDIKNFYPSIDPKRGAQIAKLMWNRSDIVFEDVNVDELVWYISRYGLKENIEADGLSEYLYTKKKRKIKKKVSKKKNGLKAVIGGVTMTRPKNKKKGPKSNWDRPKKNPNQNIIIRKLFGSALEILILTVMGYHMYQFNGRFRL